MKVGSLRRLFIRLLPLSGLLLIPLLTLIWGWQLIFYDRLWLTHDLFVHYRWANQFLLALSEGVLQPKWAALSHYGAGDPTFLYYQPGFYYVVAVLNQFGFSIWDAIKFGLLLANLMLGLTVWLILRRHTNEYLSLFGAGFSQLQPFYFFLAYSGNAFPWAFAMPFAALVVWRSLYPARASIDPWLSVALMLLVLSHILTAFMCLLVLGLERLFRSIGQRDPRVLIYWSLSVILGLGMAAFYFLPAFLTRDWVSPEGWFQVDVLDWRNSFAFPILSSWFWGIHWMNVQWIHPGLLMMIGLASVVIYRYRQDQQTAIRPVLFSLFIAAMVAIILASEWSFPAWHLSETLRIVQRPYRFITVLMLSVIWMVPLALVLGLPRHRYLRGTIIIIFLTPFLLFCALQAQIALEGKSPQPRLEQAMQGDFGQPEYFPAGTGPFWKDYFTQGGFEQECIDRDWSCEEQIWQTHYRRWRLEGTASTAIRLPVFDFPTWQVRQNGTVLAHSTDPNTGLILVSLPAGQHDIELVWVPTPIEWIGRVVSIVSLLVFFGVLLVKLIKNAALQKTRYSDSNQTP